MLKRLLARVRGEGGFGLIELVMALALLNVGIMALVAAFTSGQVALARAGKVATATSLADAQMELYRAIKYTSIALDGASVTAADSTYKCDAAYGATCSTTTAITRTCATVTNDCSASRIAAGADGKSYRVDTYITEETPPLGRPVRRVTIVVRNPLKLDAVPLARQTSNFDQSTG